MIGLIGLGFGGGNPPIDPKVSNFEGGDPLPTARVVGSGGWHFGFGRVGFLGWVDAPNFSVILLPKIHFNLLNWCEHVCVCNSIH